MRTAHLLLLLALAACGGTLLGDGSGEVYLAPATLPFEAHVGYGRIEKAEIYNGGRISQPVTLQISGPFRLRSSRMTVPSGRTEIDVLYSPGNEGTHEGRLVLTVTATKKTSTITLLGHATEAPDCAPASPCDYARRDGDTGACRRGPVEEGTPCSSGNGCQVDERCVAHECVGVPRDCDDDDVCTDDSCNPLLGQCVHLETSCPEPEEACRVAACHPVTGCYEKDAPAGTVCGEFTCKLAQFCKEGTCVSEKPPEDYPCVRPCGEGQCRSEQCVRTDGKPSALLDERTPLFQSDRPITFDGLMDEDGNTYFVSYLPGGQSRALLSLNPDGFLRYPGEGRLLVAGEGWPRMLRWNDRIFVSAGDVVELRRTDTGEAEWTTWLARLGTPIREPEVAVAARSGDRLITAGYEPPDPPVSCEGDLDLMKLHVFALDVFGDIAWEASYEGRLRQRGVATGWPGDESTLAQGLVVDGSGNVYFTLAGCGGDDTVIGLDSEGSEVLRVPIACRGCETLAVAGDNLYLAGGIVVQVPGGAPRWDLGLPGGFAPRLGSRIGYVLGEGAVHGLDLEAMDVAWTHEMPESELRDALLTSPAGSVLAFDVRPGGRSKQTWVTELLASGDVKRACTMGDFVMEGSPAVGDEFIVVSGIDATGRRQVRRYELPRLRLGGAGWVSAGGNPLRDGTPR